MAATPTIARPREETRERLLEAAARLYAQHGARGATTRAIAAEAAVNEVTLFRLFGSKEALLQEALAHAAHAVDVASLPARPRDPEAELAAWFDAESARFRDAKAFMRHCFADAEEHPAHLRPATGLLDSAAAALRGYVKRLVAAGLAPARPRQRDAAVAMLLSTLVTDALARDELPEVFRIPAARASRVYARLFLDALADAGKPAAFAWGEP